MTQPPLPVPAGTPKINERQARIFADLRRVHLRHPGLVKRTVTRLFYLDTVTHAQIAAATMEWLRLGFRESAPTQSHGGSSHA